MRFALFVAAAATAVIVTAPAAVAAKSPCSLVTAADAKAALGTAVKRPKLQNLGLFASCFYATSSAASVTVQSRAIDRATFVKSAKANPGPVKAVAGLGGTAFSAAAGSTLLVWKNGTAVTILVLGTANPLASEETLAKKALARL